MCNYNTDMADERVDEYKKVHNLTDLDGIKVQKNDFEDFSVVKVDVLNENGVKSIEKEIVPALSLYSIGK